MVQVNLGKLRGCERAYVYVVRTCMRACALAVRVCTRMLKTSVRMKVVDMSYRTASVALRKQLNWGLSALRRF